MLGLRGDAGSGINDRAPEALIFTIGEDILRLGALIAGELFGRGCLVLRVSAAQFATMSAQMCGTRQLMIEAGTCATGFGEVGVKDRHPDVVAVRYLAALVDAGQTD